MFTVGNQAFSLVERNSLSTNGFSLAMASQPLYNSKRKLNVLEECNMDSKPSKGSPPCRPQTFSLSSSRQPPSPLFSSAREIRRRQSSLTPQFWIGPSRFPQNRKASCQKGFFGLVESQTPTCRRRLPSSFRHGRSRRCQAL